jgi:hypothetical protein
MTSDLGRVTSTLAGHTPPDSDFGPIAQAVKVLSPDGDGQPFERVMIMSHISPAKVAAINILMGEYFASTSQPTRASNKNTMVPKKAINFWELDEGSRTSMLYMHLNISSDGRGRNQVADVLKGLINMGRRMLGRRNTNGGGNEFS